MQSDLTEKLVCPECSGLEMQCTAFEKEAQEIECGVLTCRDCGQWFRIENGILDLLPSHLAVRQKRVAFSKKHDLALKNADQPGDPYKQTQIDFFDATNERYDQQISHSPYFNALEENYFLPWLRESFGPGNVIIDVGCGTGRQLLPIARRGIRVLGLDISEGMLAFTRQKLAAEGLQNSANLVLADCEAMPLKDGLFDGCVLNGTLHHLKDQEAAILESARVIRPGGAFFSCDPHHSLVRFVFDLSMKIWKLHDEEAGEDLLLREKALRAMLDKASVQARLEYSTFVLPHAFLLLKPAAGRVLLDLTDRVLGGLPFIKLLAGQIVARGIKT